jgi:hypothetical protein
MSSATSTDATQQVRAESRKASSQQGLQPWQFFVLAALACATAVTYLARGQGPTAVILLSVLMGATALAGLAALRTVLPLTGAYDGMSTPVVGQRVRATLERDKLLTLRAIKELEFDRAMGKISEEDFKEMSVRLRMRATRLMRQLEAGAGYRDRVERDLVKRLGEKGAQAAPTAEAARACPKCSVGNDTDAKFCKNCGERL